MLIKLKMILQNKIQFNYLNIIKILRMKFDIKTKKNSFLIVYSI